MNTLRCHSCHVQKYGKVEKTDTMTIGPCQCGYTGVLFFPREDGTTDDPKQLEG